MALSAGGRDCLRAGDTCSSDDTCSPRLRTLRQCVAGDGSVKLGPGARNQCENAMTALLSTPLHGCQCKRGMKKEKNCLSIYWSLHQSVLHGKTGIKRPSTPRTLFLSAIHCAEKQKKKKCFIVTISLVWSHCVSQNDLQFIYSYCRYHSWFGRFLTQRILIL